MYKYMYNRQMGGWAKNSGNICVELICLGKQYYSCENVMQVDRGAADREGCPKQLLYRWNSISSLLKILSKLNMVQQGFVELFRILILSLIWDIK
jgi:hypothetical protein